MGEFDEKPTACLQSWDDVRGSATWSGILIGNGSSQAVWEPFGYTSLFETAKSKEEVQNPLTADDIVLFEDLDTTNFERVLESLATAKLVGKALKHDTSDIEARYQSIQQALVQAVHSKHVPYAKVTQERLKAIRSDMLSYDFVYSTNYDLLLYWALMHEEGKGFKDFFWTESFDLANTELWGKATKILFLHGGLHLYRISSGSTIKRRATFGRNLLELFGQPIDGESGAVPLFIAEGSSKDKLTAIYRSDYLSFAYAQLLDHDGPLVVFGHALGDSDQHIIDALKKAGVTEIAVSMLPGDDDTIVSQKAGIISKFPKADICFFNAVTHPLGTATLKVKHE